MRASIRPVLLALAPLLGLGCGSTATVNPDGGTVSGDMATLPPPALGAPITASAGQWTWVDFPDSSCNDGTPTGIGVNPGTSDNLLIHLEGGGACWDATTCLVLHTAALGPYGQANFGDGPGGVGTIFDRTNPNNPFRDWTFVFVPYCTGDTHGGDNVVTYTVQGKDTQFHHTGRRNVEAYLKRVAATWKTPTKLVFTGSSAGGYGSVLAYPVAKRYYPSAKAYLLDDSGPALVGDDMPPGYRKAWFAQWNLGAELDALCPTCRDDFSTGYSALSSTYPNDRIALLSSEQDKTISGYLLLSQTAFQVAINDLATMRLDALPNARYFFQTGGTHTMEFDLPKHTTGGVNVLDWIAKMVSDDPAWASVKP